MMENIILVNTPNKSGSKTWLDRWQLQHARIMVLFTTGSSLFFLARPEPGQLSQIIILGTGVAFLGLPHGALDHLIARPIFKPRFKKVWPLVFLIFYVGLIGITLACWWIAGTFTLSLFLIFSAIHFGLEDVNPELSPGGCYWLEVLARGLIVVILPLYFFNSAVMQIFLEIIPGTNAQIMAILFTQVSTFLLAGLAPLLVFFFFYHLRQAITKTSAVKLSRIPPQSAKQLQLTTALEIAALGLLMATVPPLVSFVLYFCGWHSIRHTLQLAALLNPGQPLEGLRHFVVLALPLTFLTIAGAGIFIFWQYNIRGYYYGPSLQIIFITLSALTFPHMVLRALVMKQSARSICPTGRARAIAK